MKELAKALLIGIGTGGAVALLVLWLWFPSKKEPETLEESVHSMTTNIAHWDMWLYIVLPALVLLGGLVGAYVAIMRDADRVILRSRDNR